MYKLKIGMDKIMEPSQNFRLAPNFNAPATNGKTLKLSDFKGKQLVLFFYPLDNSYLCSKEAEYFRDYYHAFSVANTEILGISLGGIEKKEKFCYKSHLPFNLISDKDKTISTSFGCLKSIKFWKFEFDYINRTPYLLDTSGQIVKTWNNIKINNHAKEVLESARQLHKTGKL